MWSTACAVGTINKLTIRQTTAKAMLMSEDFNFSDIKEMEGMYKWALLMTIYIYRTRGSQELVSESETVAGNSYYLEHI